MKGDISLRSEPGFESFCLAAANEGLDLHSVMLVHRGVLVAEVYRPPFDAETPHRMYSMTKSFTSTGIGIVVAEGRLSVEDRVVDLFPELVPDHVDENLAQLKVKHLLTMTAEHGQPALPSQGPPPFSIAGFLAERLTLPPGSRFDYSNACSYMLAAIVQRVAGETLEEFLRARIFAPLDISARHWLRSDEGVTNGAWGLHLTTHELARFGELYLRRGRWGDRQLLPEAWVEEATGKRVSSWGNAGARDWMLGYGYQFWRGREDSYRADGLLGQFCLVLPKQDIVFVTTAGTLNTQRIVDLFWEHVPKRSTAGVSMPTSGSLRTFLCTQGDVSSPHEADLNDVRFVLGTPFALPSRMFGGQAPLVSVKMEITTEHVSLLIADARAVYRLKVGRCLWEGAVTPLSTLYPEPYKARACWPEPTRLVIDLVFTEAGFRLNFDFDLDRRLLTLRTPANPGLEGKVVIGRAV